MRTRNGTTVAARAATVLLAVMFAAAGESPAGPVTVRPAKVPARATAAVLVRPGAFNAPGNLLCGWTGDEREDDRLVELTPNGATVWECRLRPGGSLVAFSRAAEGTTLVAQWTAGKLSRVLAVDSAGKVRNACQLASADSAAPRPSSLHAVPGGGMLVSTEGWAATLSRRWRIEREMIHRGLSSAAPLSDGRWLAAFHDPDRFAVYDPASRTLKPVPLDALCHLWEARRAEEVSPGRWRFYGCFCVTGEAPPGEQMPRKTMEVVDTDAEGRFMWAWGSTRAIRVEEFGTQRCATYTRAVTILPGDHLLVLDAYPAECRVAELDSGGEAVRVHLRVAGDAPSPGASGTFGETACGLVGFQVLAGAPAR